MHEQAEQLLSHVRTAWRHRWYAVVFAWIIALGGWSAVYLTPNRYEVSARVYVDTRSVLRPLLAGLAVQPDVDQMVTMMSRTVISRPNLEKVIRMADMDIGLRTPEDRQKLIGHLTRELAIVSAGRENLYTISYADKDPQQAKRVVQSLLTLFVEGSLGDKRKDSDSARRFIDNQLKGYSEKLVAAENAVTAFKRRHQGLMPGQGAGGDYFVRLSDARTALRQAELALREAETSRDAIKKQLARDDEIMSQPAGRGATVGAFSEIDTRIRTLEEKLDGLRLTYTEQHPDVVALVRIIAQLREQKQAEDRSGKPVARQGPVYEQLTVALATAEANVAAMKARVAEFGIRYNELQASANALPLIEAEFAQLNRDYDVIKRRYDTLLERRESAQISGDVEVSDSAMGFRVVDSPQVPLAPSTPNRLRLNSLVLLAALGGGFGIAFLIGQLRPTFSDEQRLREVSGLQVLGTVAMAWTDEQRKRRMRGLAVFVFSFLSLLAAYVAVMASIVLTVSRA